MIIHHKGCHNVVVAHAESQGDKLDMYADRL